jgi:3-dehydroquinate dehydratase/shikimate dehydrogenase
MSEERSARICVPVCARTADELRRFVERAARLADIIELRLDCLDEDQLNLSRRQPRKLLDGLLRELLQSRDTPFIVTFRPSEQGGHRSLDVPARTVFWQKIAEELSREESRGRIFADIELDLFESPHGAKLCEVAGKISIICSHHDFSQTPANIGEIYERMMRTPARVFKIAMRANAITDCVEVLRLLERARRDGRELIAVSMGEAGVLTRVLAPSRGAFLTYGSLDDAQATAPGQVGARELRELYRVPLINARTLVTGLIGSPVSHSLSPSIHNAAFAAAGLDAVYIPFEVADVSDFVGRMARPSTRELSWNLRGFSVTAPHKTAVMQHLDSVEKTASEIGAVNTVVIEGGELHGYNTDAAAAVKPLDGLINLRGSRVAVIGAGGAARALLWSLREQSAHTTVFARNVERARLTARDFNAEAASIEGASFDGFDVVVNATPLGTRGERENETPATRTQLRGARIAYDLVYNPRETRFLREAQAAGCATVGGLSMLVAQAADQFKLWTSTDAPLEVMRAAVENLMSDA